MGLKVSSNVPSLIANKANVKNASEACLKPIENIAELKKDIGKLIDLLPLFVTNPSSAHQFSVKLNKFLVDLIISTSNVTKLSNSITTEWAVLTHDYNNLEFKNGKSPMINVLWKQISTKLSNLTIKYSFNEKPIINADNIK